ncbi:TrbC/VirB2 family protein [Candidatus Nomurabacteria bacterium]|nr:TrbC/VirB2 family protein [Candidatus Nomurabacteria bacterium]
MNFIQKNWQKLAVLAYVSVLPVISLANDPACDPSKGVICNPLNTNNTLPGLIQSILEGMLKIGIPVVALAVIYCGFLFVFARGNSEKITHAKDALLYTMIGAAILLGAWAIAQMISATVLAL